MSADNPLSRISAVRLRFSRLLLLWCVVSIAVSIAVWSLGSGQQVQGERAFLGAVAAQFFVWGAIDGIFAGVGLSQARSADPREAQNLVRTLRFSFRLNFVLLAVGILLCAAGVMFRSIGILGHGIGVTTQVVFLISFDNFFLRGMLRNMP